MTSWWCHGLRCWASTKDLLRLWFLAYFLASCLCCDGPQTLLGTVEPPCPSFWADDSEHKRGGRITTSCSQRPCENGWQNVAFILSLKARRAAVQYNPSPGYIWRSSSQNNKNHNCLMNEEEAEAHTTLSLPLVRWAIFEFLFSVSLSSLDRSWQWLLPPQMKLLKSRKSSGTQRRLGKASEDLDVGNLKFPYE